MILFSVDWNKVAFQTFDSIIHLLLKLKSLIVNLIRGLFDIYLSVKSVLFNLCYSIVSIRYYFVSVVQTHKKSSPIIQVLLFPLQFE